MICALSLDVREPAYWSIPMEKLDTKKLAKLERALTALLESVDPRFSLPQALFFLKAARLSEDGKKATLGDIREEFGETMSGGLHSSYLGLLVPEGRSTSHGLGFIERQTNPDNLREKLLTLTPEGRAVVARMLEPLE